MQGMKLGKNNDILTNTFSYIEFSYSENLKGSHVYVILLLRVNTSI